MDHFGSGLASRRNQARHTSAAQVAHHRLVETSAITVASGVPVDVESACRLLLPRNKTMMSVSEILARRPVGSSPGATKWTSRARKREILSEDRTAEAILDEIRTLLSAGNILAAQELTTDAVAKFPGDVELRNAKRVLCDGKSYVVPGKPEPSRRPELEWLRDPPADYRGKWVALVGREVVASGETLKEVLGALPSDLERRPLAVQIAPQ